MRTAEILQYICEQFPAAIGHLPLVEKLDDLEKTAYNQAVEDAVNAIACVKNLNCDEIGCVRRDCVSEILSLRKPTTTTK